MWMVSVTFDLGFPSHRGASQTACVRIAAQCSLTVDCLQHGETLFGEVPACLTLISCTALCHVEGSRPEWCILSMIYSGDTSFWSETLDVNCTALNSTSQTQFEVLCVWGDEGGGGGEVRDGDHILRVGRVCFSCIIHKSRHHRHLIFF